MKLFPGANRIIQKINAMKRFILTAVAALLVSVSASAQLAIKASVQNAPEKLLTLQMTYSWLYHSDISGYEIRLRTDNQFDRSGTTVEIGDTPESALQTLRDMKVLLANETAGVSVAQTHHEDITLLYVNQLGSKMFWIKQDGNGGKSWLSEKQIDRLVEYFEGLVPPTPEPLPAAPATPVPEPSTEAQ